MLSLFYGLDFSFKFYNVCAVKPIAMTTVHLNYAKRRLDILKLLSMSDRRIGRRKQVKGATD